MATRSTCPSGAFARGIDQRAHLFRLGEVGPDEAHDLKPQRAQSILTTLLALTGAASRLLKHARDPVTVGDLGVKGGVEGDHACLESMQGGNPEDCVCGLDHGIAVHLTDLCLGKADVKGAL